ncbi:MAG: tetratricopeptide repeat protein [Bacteroidetes bacterium]|nr:tetratricopeptide repeat protein [Bacteroidota bacterium]
MKNKHLVMLIAIFCSLSYSELSAQEVFDDIAYIPAPIENNGTNTPKIIELANSAFEAIKNRHNKDAQESFDAIIALDKYNVQGLYGLAYCQFADGEYEKSIELLEPIINVNQTNAALYSLRGRAYMALSNFDKAISDFEKSSSIGSESLDLLSLSQCQYYAGNFTEAVVQAEKFIGKQAQNALGYFAKGMAKCGLKEYEAAIVELTKVTELEAKNSVAYYYISRNNVLMEDYNKALKNVSKAIKLNQEYVEAIDLRAEIRYNVHDYPNAIFDCNRVIELDGVSENTYLIRGKSNLKIGLKKEACADFKLALKFGNKAVEEMIGKNCN